MLRRFSAFSLLWGQTQGSAPTAFSLRRVLLLCLAAGLLLVGCDLIQPTPILTPDGSATPGVVCTPVSCGPDAVLFCPGDCPGGCGAVCATVTPPPPIVSAPADWAELETWLAEAWGQGVNPAAVRSALVAAGRQTGLQDWSAADLDGDLQDEWIVRLNTLPGEPDYQEFAFGTTNQLWIVNQGGVVYRSETLPAPSGVAGFGDVTGDGRPEVWLRAADCGASTCYASYRIVSAEGGSFRNIVAPDPATGATVIGMTNPDIPILFDHTGDGVADFTLHGGTLGSAGAGIMRPYTDIWAWDGSALAKVETLLDGTNWRHHILYEANELFAQSNYPAAILAYEAVINDASLQTYAHFNASETQAYTDMSLFAAFRLILADVQVGEGDRAASRLAWLQTTYPAAAVTIGAGHFLATWEATAALTDACQSAVQEMSAYPNVTGVLTDMGYGNPSLTLNDLCPFSGEAGLNPPPDTWEGLAQWMVQVYVAGLSDSQVADHLLATQWLKRAQDWTTLDSDGDGALEWVAALSMPGAVAYSPDAYPGDLWIVGPAGILYQYAADLATPETQAPQIVAVTDMTGDGRPDLMIDEHFCGAHTCFGNYRLLSAHDGSLRNIVNSDLPNADVISISYPTPEIRDATGDGILDFVVHGGNIGSVGAGMVRTYTEIWAWDNSALSRRQIVLDPTTWRHHILYEANAEAAGGQLELAATLYEQVIQDPSLENPFPFEGEESEIYPALAQLAAFRLVVVRLQQGQVDAAQSWRDWLLSNAADGLITQAAQAFYDTWVVNNAPDQACSAAQAILGSVEEPAGVVTNLGYGNPSLTSADFCSP